MKLLLCPRCSDVVKLDYKRRSCQCGYVSGLYRKDGAHADVSPDALVIGIDNNTIRRAIGAFTSGHPDYGYLTLSAWVMAKTAPRVHWEEKEEAA